jgi:DNA polymerase-3 subunit gamma/tau
MPAKILALKYRPQTFDELWIQDHVKETLKRAIQRNRLANAYLFAGPRGVGKTTCARILAKSLNCEQGPTVTPCNKCSFCQDITGSRSMDVIELDGASNRGIDQIRELRENIKYSPTAGRFKVYIIDEVHMLTKEAFNALLKTLEEPPPHAKFIFATTAAHDVPTTIISRCQRFDFRKATPLEIKQRLEWLCKQEGIKASEPALVAIARRADGALRDGESILDQMAAYKPEGIEVGDVEELLGLVPAGMFFEYADRLLARDAAGLLRFLDRFFEAGYDHMELYRGIVGHFRDLLLVDVSGTSPGLLPEETERLTGQARTFGRERLLSTLSTLTESEQAAKTTQLPRVLLEVVSLELAGVGNSSSEPAPAIAADRPATASPDVWTELRLRVNQSKPMLAASLEQALDASYAGQTLTVRFPARLRLVAEKVEQSASLLSKLLSEVAGPGSNLKVEVVKAPERDPAREQFTRIFGRVEEERRR